MCYVFCSILVTFRAMSSNRIQNVTCLHCDGQSLWTGNSEQEEGGKFWVSRCEGLDNGYTWNVPLRCEGIAQEWLSRASPENRQTVQEA